MLCVISLLENHCQPMMSGPCCSLPGLVDGRQPDGTSRLAFRPHSRGLASCRPLSWLVWGPGSISSVQLFVCKHAMYFTASNHEALQSFRALVLLENVFALISSQSECRKLFKYIQKVALAWVKNMFSSIDLFMIKLRRKRRVDKRRVTACPGLGFALNFARSVRSEALLCIGQPSHCIRSACRLDLASLFLFNFF